jgi:hypothetical protein
MIIGMIEYQFLFHYFTKFKIIPLFYFVTHQKLTIDTICLSKPCN